MAETNEGFRPKILYLMRIDWNWIFQRPQILALELEKNYDLTVLFPKERTERKGVISENPKPKHYIETIFLPFRDKVRLIGKLNFAFLRKCIGDLGNYDIIWIGYPTFAGVIPSNYKGKILYDCMDDYEAMYPNGRGKEYLIRSEKELVGRADVIFTSSEVLRKKIYRSSGRKSILLRNGCSGELDISKPQKGNIKAHYDLGYFGTISDWMDIELLENSINKRKDITYHLIGPAADSMRRNNPGIIWEGSIAHEKLTDMVKNYDCLVMPFVLNDIIAAVDPVKLYEYISMGKCIISVYYPEIERFRDFVYFYKSAEEYDSLLNVLCQRGFPPKFNELEQKRFLAENTWQQRANTIEKIIKELYREKAVEEF